MEKSVKILMKEFVTHDVKRFILEKPESYEFVPGQATEVSINKESWRDEKRPFTFTSLNEDLVLEFTIKAYSEHEGVTKELHNLNPVDELNIGDAWGAINYKGKGVFIAGGAGITPFIAILRELKKKGEIKGNKLIFSNKKQKDIILEKEFKEMFKENPEDLIFVLSRENKEGYENKKIDKEFLKNKITDFNQNFYICGPKQFVKDIKSYLEELGAKIDGIVIEE